MYHSKSRTGQADREKDGAAESWEIDIINEHSVSKTRIKRRGDGSRVNQKISKDVLPAKVRLFDHAASTIVSQFHKSNTWPDEQFVDPRFGESELEPMFKKRKMTTLQYQPPPIQTAAVAGPNDIDWIVSYTAGDAEMTRTERGALNICRHGHEKSLCKDYGGSSICEHGRRKRQCKDCGGSSICEHGRIKSRCKDCGGSSFCEHGRFK
jgi:hypothetical protein